MRPTRLRLTVGLTIAMLVSGCTTTDSDDADQNRMGTTDPAKLTYADVWSSDEDVDLFGRPAELLRATYEASKLSTYMGIDNSYPGYRSALASTEPRDTEGLEISEVYLNQHGADEATQWPPRQTEFDHLISVSASGDSVRGVVCSYKILEQPRYNATLEGGYFTTLITLTRNDQPDGPVGAPDDDPSTALPEHRIPSWNVFEGWTIEQLYLDDNSSLHDEPRAGCARWMNQQFPDHIYNDAGLLVPPHTYGDNPPTMPMQPPYPEWIPPATTE